MPKSNQASVQATDSSLKIKLLAVIEHFKLWQVLLGSCITILTILGAARLSLASYIKSEVKTEVDRQMSPGNFWARADSAFAINHEQEGFKYLDQAVTLYQQEGEDGKTALESLLDSYLFRLSCVKQPEFYENKIENIIKILHDGGITENPYGKCNEAWFWLRDGQDQRAQQIYSEMTKHISINNDDFGTLPYILQGEGFCALAKGKVPEAKSLLDQAYNTPPLNILLPIEPRGSMCQTFYQVYPIFSNSLAALDNMYYQDMVKGASKRK